MIKVGDRTVVDGVSFEWHAGEIVGLVGASGSGKTMTARAILGLVDAEPGVVAGKILIRSGSRESTPYGRYPRGRVSRDRAFAGLRGEVLAYIPQDAPSALDPTRTVWEQVRDVRGGDPRPHLLTAGFHRPEAVGGLYPHELSGGMAQRVAIAQALACGSRFLVADEPTTGLDPSIARDVLRAFGELALAGIGVLLITHDLRVLPDLADRVLIIDEGEIVEELEPGQLREGEAKSHAGQRILEATRRIAGGRLGTVVRRHRRDIGDHPEAWGIDNLRVSYRSGWFDRREALSGASVVVHQGERIAIIGESGCGKTSLCRAGLGLIGRDSGTVRVLGMDTRGWSEGRWHGVRSSVQLLVQHPTSMLHPDLPVRTALLESAWLHGAVDNDRSVDEVLEQVDLSHRADARPRELSGGEARRAGLARVLLARPRLVVADEPTSGLDAHLKHQLVDLLSQRLGPECGLVLVSHDLPLVASTSDRIVVMAQGRVVDDFPTQRLGHPSHHPVTKKLLADAGLERTVELRP